LIQEEERLRNTYRRNADDSVEPVSEVIAVLNDNSAFAELEDQLRELGDVIAAADGDTAEDALQEVGSAFGSVAGAREISSELSSARREIRSGNREDAREEWRNAVAAFEEQQNWRAEAERELLPELATYLEQTSDTIGARQQERLTREQALFIARCSADHRNLSLYF
jgi:hypothetical protein